MSQLDSLAKIFTLTTLGLNQPNTPSFLLQVKRAVHEACAFYWTELIQSDQNQVVKKSDSIPFVNNQFRYSLEDITDMTMPDWVEVQIDTDPNSDDFNWVLAMVVNRDSLPLYQDRTELACAFYSDLVTGTRYIEWSYIPFTQVTTNRNFRIWYDPNISIATGDDDATNFPVEYNYMVVVDARLKLIPTLMQMDVEKAAENKTSEFILKAKMDTWMAMKADLIAEKITWERKWKNFCLASRVNSGGGVKKSIIPSYL